MKHPMKLWTALLPALALPLLAVAKPGPAPADTGHEFVFLADSRPVLVRLHVQIDGKAVESVWKDFVRSVFQSHDKQNRGMLDSAAVKKLPSPRFLFSSQIGPAPMTQITGRPDGTVTLLDLEKSFRRQGGAPFQMRFNSNQRMGGRYFLVDGRLAPPASPEALEEALFKLLDTNKDGKLSRDELARAPEVLLQKDANDDEMVTADELLPTSNQNNLVFAEYMLATRGQPQAAPFVLLTPEESSRVLARRLLEHYGLPKKQGPSPADLYMLRGGKPPQPAAVKIPSSLTRKQIGLDEATFKLLDVDGDGKLDVEELSRFARRAPDVELKVVLGKHTALETLTRKDSPLLATQLRKTKSGAVVLHLDAVRLEFRADRVARSSQANREFYIAQFKAADTDGNGYIDRTEAQRSPFFANMFSVFDRDGDGKIFEKEMLAYVDEVESLQAKAHASMASLEIADQDKGLFDLLDTNRDGRLSVRELRNAVQLIDSLDRDGDGHISRAEIPRNYLLRLHLGPLGFAQPISMRARLIRGGGGLPPEPTAGPLWFRKMDRNRDGDVSRREFLGTREEFDRIDTDGDGLISLEEAERYDNLMRKRK
jgi:Ca2+-binding EF-hand superfamily protein